MVGYGKHNTILQQESFWGLCDSSGPLDVPLRECLPDRNTFVNKALMQDIIVSQGRVLKETVRNLVLPIVRPFVCLSICVCLDQNRTLDLVHRFSCYDFEF